MDNETTDDSPEEKREDPFSLVAQPRYLFNISPNSLSSLYRIFTWAAQGTFLSTTYNEMIQDVENTWKQERSAFVAIVVLKIIKDRMYNYL
uniref:Uncharacterized protein n=1 Tax=Ditylenchus dipsaci TaxID=166011 RepID=A0A915DD26_9BILA